MYGTIRKNYSARRASDVSDNVVERSYREKVKKEKESKKKRAVVELKEIKFSCRIDTHDFNTKLNHAKRFLSDGNKVKITIVFSGRENESHRQRICSHG